MGIIYNMSFAAHLMKHKPVKSSARVSKKVQPIIPEKMEVRTDKKRSRKVGFGDGPEIRRSPSPPSPSTEEDFYGRGGSKRRNKTMRKRKTRKN